MESKVCSKCKIEKPVECFGARPERPNGLRPSCKACQRKSTADYRSRNPHKTKEYTASHRAENTARMAAWRSKNPERNREIDRASKERNREAIRLADRERYAKNRDQIRERKSLQRRLRIHEALEKERAYREANREKVNEKSRRACERRRAKAKGKLENAIRAGVHAEIRRGSKNGRKTFELLGYSVEELKVHLERQFEHGMGWHNFSRQGWHIDHIVPVSSFKYETPEDPEFKQAWALTNLRPLWASENLSKGAQRLLLI